MSYRSFFLNKLANLCVRLALTSSDASVGGSTSIQGSKKISFAFMNLDNETDLRHTAMKERSSPEELEANTS